MQTAYLVAGLGYGDEGKGSIVDYIAGWGCDCVIRYNGGAQAAHNVVTPEGKWHTFQQFCSGMFHPKVRSHLSRYMLVNPMNMMKEAEHLKALGITDHWERTSVDPRALIITPFHVELNRIRAKHSEHPDNTVGQGIGVTREYHNAEGLRALFAADIPSQSKTKDKLNLLRHWCIRELARAGIKPTETFLNESIIDRCLDWYAEWPANFVSTEDELMAGSMVVFEGAQGVLLDEDLGEKNFNTWTCTTYQNALTLLLGTKYHISKVGVTRTYLTRHGAGPLETEHSAVGELVRGRNAEPHNEQDGFPGAMRYGYYDHQLFRRAVQMLDGIDMLAVNHMDVINNPVKFDANKITLIQGHGPTRIQKVTE